MESPRITQYELKETILEVKDVNKSYGNNRILRDINFSVKNISRPNLNQGQIFSLVGRSGSGKSTLFSIMAGLLTPDSGVVNILPEGVNPEFSNIFLGAVKEGEMGVVFQNSYIFPWRKIKQILMMAIKENKQIASFDRWDAVQALAEHVGITEHLGKYSSQLSGGQRQRVAICEQILNGGDYLLLDEPFSGLDTLTIDRVTKILVDISLSDEYKTIVIISHDLSNSLAISDHAFILAKEEGKEGATITKEISLVERNLAWDPDIKGRPEFRELLNEVKTLL